MNNQVLSIPQMQELIDLGIDTSKASMYWGFHITDIEKKDPILVISKGPHFTFVGEYIPTFTLQDIISILPKRIPYYGGEDYVLSIDYCCFKDDNECLITYYTDSIYEHSPMKFQPHGDILEAAFELLKWCKQNNYI